MVSSPSPPDPYKTAAAQGSANLQSAVASGIIGNVNETNPYGSVNYNQIGTEYVTDAQGKQVAVPRYQRNVSLSPEQQKLLNLQNQMQTNLGHLGVSQSNRLQGLLGTNLNTKGITGWQTYGKGPNLQTSVGKGPNLKNNYVQGGNTEEAFSKDRARVEAALMSRYNTQAGTARSAQDTSLAARGLTPGSEMYGQAADEWNRSRNDAVSQSILAGGQEQSRLLGEASKAAGFSNEAAQQEWTNAINRATFGNQAKQQDWGNDVSWTNAMNALRGQQLGERAQLRNAPINEISALMSGSQVSMPQFQAYNAPSVAAAPIGDYISNNYNAEMQQYQGMLSGLFGLGSAALGGVGAAGGFGAFMSDRRAKRDIEPLTGTLAGLPLYTFYFRDGLGQPLGLQIGVMSDEVKQVYPEAVSVGDDGFDRVDYGYLRERNGQ